MAKEEDVNGMVTGAATKLNTRTGRITMTAIVTTGTTMTGTIGNQVIAVIITIVGMTGAR
jgi:hypothetical protein